MVFKHRVNLDNPDARQTLKAIEYLRQSEKATRAGKETTGALEIGTQSVFACLPQKFKRSRFDNEKVRNCR